MTVTGCGMNKTVLVTTNETSCGELSWDGVPDKEGWMSGGRYKITVQMVDGTVVVKEITEASHKGIGSDVIAKTIIPAKKIPWTGTVSHTTVTVFRVAQMQTETKGPSQAMQADGAGVPRPAR